MPLQFVAYLEVRPQTSDPALFLGVHGRRLTPSNMALTFRRYATAAGVNKRKRITPHTLRHVFATELLSAGANLRQIQELLGHKHLDSTQRYTRVTAHQLRGAIKRLPWTATATLPESSTHDGNRTRVTFPLSEGSERERAR